MSCKEFVLIARQCTARCSQRVAPRIIGVYTLFIIGVFCWVLFFNEDELQNVVGPHEQRAVHCLAMRTNSCFLTFGNGEIGWKFGIRNWNRSNVKVPHLALQGVSTEFVLIEKVRAC